MAHNLQAFPTDITCSSYQIDLGSTLMVLWGYVFKVIDMDCNVTPYIAHIGLFLNGNQIDDKFMQNGDSWSIPNPSDSKYKQGIHITSIFCGGELQLVQVDYCQWTLQDAILTKIGTWPSQIVDNTSYTIHGNLKKSLSNNPITGEKVYIYEDNAAVVNSTTDTSGNFTLTWTGHSGKLTSVVYPGSAFYDGTIAVNGFTALFLAATPTHYLDIELIPYSWYTSGSAANYLIQKLADINGLILNFFSSITDWQYLGTNILLEDDLVIIRILLRSLSTSSVSSLAIIAIPAWVTTVIALILIIAIAVGLYRGYLFLDAVFNQLLGQAKYSAQDIGCMVYGGCGGYTGVVPSQLTDCDKNYANDPIGWANCYKSVVCGAADGMADAFKLTTNCTTQQINQKMDACTIQYQVDHDLTKFQNCIKGVASDSASNTKGALPKGGSSMLGILFVAGLAIVGLFMFSRPKSPSFTIKEERK
jgi:hypothetical protein